MLCVGLNYRLHAEEAGLPIPEYPAFFGRWTVSLVAGGAPVPVPAGEPGLDWEVELAAVVGRPLYRVDPDAALSGVLGYAAFNDLSAAPTRCTRGCGRWERTPTGPVPSPPSSPPTRWATLVAASGC